MAELLHLAIQFRTRHLWDRCQLFGRSLMTRDWDRKIQVSKSAREILVRLLRRRLIDVTIRHPKSERITALARRHALLGHGDGWRRRIADVSQEDFLPHRHAVLWNHISHVQHLVLKIFK